MFIIIENNQLNNLFRTTKIKLILLQLEYLSHCKCSFECREVRLTNDSKAHILEHHGGPRPKHLVLKIVMRKKVSLPFDRL